MIWNGNGFEKRIMEVPFADVHLTEPPKPDFYKIVARCLRDYRLEKLESGEGHLEFEDNIVRFRANSPQRRFHRGTAYATGQAMVGWTGKTPRFWPIR